MMTNMPTMGMGGFVAHRKGSKSIPTPSQILEFLTFGVN